MRKVRIVQVSGYRAGEEVDLPDNRALTYCRNGQAEPVGWEPEPAQPVNRMLDTSTTTRPRRRRKKAGEEENE